MPESELTEKREEFAKIQAAYSHQYTLREEAEQKVEALTAANKQLVELEQAARGIIEWGAEGTMLEAIPAHPRNQRQYDDLKSDFRKLHKALEMARAIIKGESDD